MITCKLKVKKGEIKRIISMIYEADFLNMCKQEEKGKFQIKNQCSSREEDNKGRRRIKIEEEEDYCKKSRLWWWGTQSICILVYVFYVYVVV